jgi:hypothetical protein
LAFTKTLTINVSNVNEAPTLTGLGDNNVAENAGTNAVVGSFSASDPDAGSSFSYQLVTGTGDTGNGSFNINGNTLRATSNLNFEGQNSYSIRVRVTDNGTPNLIDEGEFTINVTDVNEAPTNINLSSNAIAENSGSNALVGNLSTVDPDGDTSFSYTLVSGGANFNIPISTNQLRAINSFNYESGPTSYNIQVRSEDGGGLAFTKTLTINVTDVNEAPTNINLSSNTIAENSG